jgi:FtsH-binding integral membrane protein
MKNYSSSISQIVSQALSRTFLWMSLGLMITGLISYFLSNTSFMYYFLNVSMYGRLFRIILLGTQIGLSVALFLGIEKFSYLTLVSLFLSFSAVTGMSLSVLFLIYELSSIIGIFFITSGMFFGLALYGLITKKDFSPLYGFVNMMLWGLIIFSILNIFVKSILFSNLLCIIGIAVFSLLTIMDIQSIKILLSQYAYDKEMQNKLSILGAAILYQHFLNLFLRLLKLFGKKRNK